MAPEQKSTSAKAASYLDKAIASFIMANAAMGRKVHMCFYLLGVGYPATEGKIRVKKDSLSCLFGVMMPKDPP
jgi:hypothetical protein